MLGALLIDFAQQAGLKDVRLLRGNERRAPWIRRRGLGAAVTGTTRVAGREVTLRLGLPRTFPFELPVVQLDRASAFPHAPHVEADGAVCYVVPQGLVINRHDPAGILRYAFEEATETLRRGWEENVDDEFMDEFGSYWAGTGPQHTVDSFLHIGDQIRQVHLQMTPRIRQRKAARRVLTPMTTWVQTQAQRQQARRREVGKWRRLQVERPARRGLGWVYDDPADPGAFHQRDQRPGGRQALYVPLPREARLHPPRLGEPWSAPEVRAIVRGHLVAGSLETLDRLTTTCGDELLLILALPRPRGGNTLVGLRYFGLGGQHPLASETVCPDHRLGADPEPVYVRRLDRALVTARGGAHTDLAGQRVLLVGCGAVGGHLATLLATAGVGHLTLVDPDRLAWENVFRHVLGKKALGRRKVEALAAELRERVPYLGVRAVASTLDEAVRQGEVSLPDFDLVIAATGEPSVDLDLNARLRAAGRPPAIFTWLEPFGIGGHAALSTGACGCFECLYTAPDGQIDLHNRGAFYAEASGQPRGFNLDEVGCGSFYTPFSDLDARQTAALAARLALSTLQGHEAQSVLKSWKGDPAAFLAAGYVLSPRHDVSSDRLLAGVSYASAHCRTCQPNEAA